MLKKVFCTAFLVFFAASLVNNAFAPLLPIFADGFEFGSFSQWSGVVKTYGETAYVIYGGTLHHGLYSARFTSNGGGGLEKSYCYKDIPTTSDIYVRGYFYVSKSGIGDRFLFIVLKPVGATGAAFLGWRRNPATGVVNWVFNCRNGANYPQPDMYSSYLSPHVGHWYCVELHWRMGATNGYAEAWVNGVRIGWTGYRNTAYYGGINQVQFGLPQVYNCGPTTVWADCAKISTTYVGPEPSPLFFSDGFEFGSFSQWSGVVKTYGETAYVIYGGTLHHGLWGARFASNGGRGLEKSYCYKDIPTTSDIYVRGYFYVSQSGIGDRFLFTVLKPVGATGAAFIGLKRNPANGIVSWCFNCRNGANYPQPDFYSTYLSPHPGHWYCVELHWKMGYGNGYAQAWINGVYIGWTGYRNTAYYGGINQVQFGLPQVYNCGPTTVWADCAKISTSYIGPEY